MAMAKPVISTSRAVQALEVSSGKELFVADEPVDFAQTVVAAIEARSQIGAKGRRYVQRHHDWTTNLGVLDRLLDAVESGGGSGAHSAFPRAAE
jgi:hypothetical protein